jgi:hypothetical protein
MEEIFRERERGGEREEAEARGKEAEKGDNIVR